MVLSVLEESLRTQTLLSQLKLLLRQSVQHMLKTFNYTATTIDKVYSQVGVGRNGTTVPDDHYCWMRPEDMNYDRPVTTSSTSPDLGGEIAAALATASIVFRDYTAYSKKLTTGTAAVYKFARSMGRHTPYSRGVIDIAQFYNSTSYWDEYMWGAAWMYFATRNNSYNNVFFLFTGYSGMILFSY